MTHEVYLILGANIGNIIYNIKKAINLISMYIGKIIAFSSFYLSEPWNMFTFHKIFINIVIAIYTRYSPFKVLNKVLYIESLLGRRRKSIYNISKCYLDRIIDIDILFYDNIIMNNYILTIPHKLLHLRKFVLVPINEINSKKIHPVFNVSVEYLLCYCQDHSKIIKL